MFAASGEAAWGSEGEFRRVDGEGSNGVMIKARIGEDREGAERRRAERLPVDIEARLRELGSAGSEARILNISETGFMAEIDEDFEVGARVWLMLPGRERANAVVRWTAAGKLGAEFAEPMPADSLPVTSH